ncbi:hypothetical protein ACVWXN_000331 [Bradyrhizobium sp. i1.4.4]
MKSLAYVTLSVLALMPSYAFAQQSTGHKMSDEELIKLSLSAAPEAIAKDATIVAMDHDGKMRTLRKGTGQWTCMPGHADPANPDPDVRRSKRDGMGDGMDGAQGATGE